MPSAFLFDIGNVILPFDFSIPARRLAERSRVSADEVASAIRSRGRALELGQIPSGQFVTEVCDEIGYSEDAQSFRAIYADMFDPNLPLIHFIESLKSRGIPLYLLSNTNELHADFFQSHYPVFSLFDGAIYSHEVGLMKPDPAIFTCTINRLSLKPEETVYVDDLAENCKVGAEHGLQAYCYDRHRHDEFLKVFGE